MIKSKCLFCEATIEGECDYMLEGTGLKMDGRRRPKWLLARPEFKWAWNGLDDNEFYLCPDHTDKESYAKAFEWAMAHKPPGEGE